MKRPLTLGLSRQAGFWTVLTYRGYFTQRQLWRAIWEAWKAR